ncbi:MAG TPA: cobalamin biosynthesis protein CbiD [Clostridiales bacterium]|nr:cobalamin biosynthesis protein CbiD [Clostridiales bacterium]
MDEYIVKNNKKLRLGYTTGSCAAAAAKAAARMLLEQRKVDSIPLMTPKGILLKLKVLEAVVTLGRASCGIKKDAGDDPDVTDGIMVYALAEKCMEPGVILEGGLGIGRVTKKGLEQEPGEAAINKVPRRMIREAVLEVMEELDYPGGIKVTISIPEGVEIAKKTFNPRLGIEGGISILGTSGIVEPMSEEAIKETIHLEIRLLRASGKMHLLCTPGNYGVDFAKETLGLDLEKGVKCSNYIGDTIDYAVAEGLETVVLVGHIGKLVKLAAGIMNTHSRQADGRMEILTAHAAMAGGDPELLKKIMAAITTEEALEYIKEKGLLEDTMELIMERMLYYLEKRAYDKLKLGVVTFSNQLGLLGKTKGVEELLWYIS